jgi:hypothetical protein
MSALIISLCEMKFDMHNTLMITPLTINKTKNINKSKRGEAVHLNLFIDHDLFDIRF